MFKQKTPKYTLKYRNYDLFLNIMTFMTKMTKYDFIDLIQQNMTFYDLITF